MNKFEGSLKRGPKICRNCNACHEVRIKKWVEDAYRDVIYYQCWGVSEPFYMAEKDLDKPCTQYENNEYSKTFETMKEFVNILTDKEKKELKNLL